MQDTIINNCYYIKEKTNETLLTVNWLAQSLFSGYKVILKLLKNPNREYSKEALAQFKQEILKIIQLYHPDMERVIELEVQDGYTYITVEQIQGCRLSKLKSIKQNLQIQDILFIIIRLCKALGYAHANNIVHRNLNLDNIWVITNHDQIYSTKITEFGFWQIFDLYPHGALKADTGFMAPEILENNSGKIGIASDIYALGVILYWLLTDKLPFKSVKEKKDPHFLPELPSVLNAQCPNMLDLILFKVLQREPALRYQTTDLLLADIVTLYAQEIQTVQNSESVKQQNGNELAKRPARQVNIPDKLYREIIGNQNTLTELLGKATVWESVSPLMVDTSSRAAATEFTLTRPEEIAEHDSIPEEENVKKGSREKRSKTQPDNKTDSASQKRVKKRSLENLLVKHQEKNDQGKHEAEAASVIKLTPDATRPRWHVKRFKNQLTWIDFLKNQFYQLFKFKGNILLIESPKEEDANFNAAIANLTSFCGDSLLYNHGHSLVLDLKPGTANYTLLYFLLDAYLVFLRDNLKKQKEEISFILKHDFPATLEMWIRMRPDTEAKVKDYKITADDNKEIEVRDLKNDFGKLLKCLKDFNYLFLLIRNLHYLDKGSLSLLEYGSTQIINLPIFIIGLYEAKENYELTEAPGPK